MRTEEPRRNDSVRTRRPSVLAAAALAAVALGGLLTGCGSGKASTGTETTAASVQKQQTGAKVLWVGDSIAGVEAPPLNAALTASGVQFKDASSTGGGTIVEGGKMSTHLAQSTWKDLKADIASFKPTVIAYQITTYDWGTPEQQRASYTELSKAAAGAGAELVIVSAPPFKLDDFYSKHADAIRSAPEAARAVADRSGGTIHFLDASALWGTDSAAAKAQRAADGIHSCQQGSAAFAKWFTAQLGGLYGFEPASAKEWAEGGWTADKRFAELGCG